MTERLLELAGMLAEEMRKDSDVAYATHAVVARHGCSNLSEFVDRHPGEFQIFAKAIIGMVDQVTNVRGSDDG